MKKYSALVFILLMLNACAPQADATPLPPTFTPIPPSETPLPPTPTFTPSPTATPDLAVDAFPDANAYQWMNIAAGFYEPVDIQNPRDGSGRLFIVEQNGRIQIVEGNGMRAESFLNISTNVTTSGSEQGLLGLAFHPRYKENGYFFVDYTDLNGDTVIARYQVSSDPFIADPNSEKVILHIEQPYGNHNGGGIAFGQDGMLFIGMGDGGSGGDPHGYGQSLNTLLGKILRIDVDNGDPYAIPADNPFYGSGEVNQEIWAYGLRNPWRISFDRLTNDMYIGDVGQGRWEEVDYIPAGQLGGLNFGWNIKEGFHDYQIGADENLVKPVAEYSHDTGGCSITGGYVYRGFNLAAFNGVYFYGDYCSGHIRGLLYLPERGWISTLLFNTNVLISTFGVDEIGEIYFADYGNGIIYRLEKK